MVPSILGARQTEDVSGECSEEANSGVRRIGVSRRGYVSAKLKLSQHLWEGTCSSLHCAAAGLQSTPPGWFMPWHSCHCSLPQPQSLFHPSCPTGGLSLRAGQLPPRSPCPFHSPPPRALILLRSASTQMPSKAPHATTSTCPECLLSLLMPSCWGSLPSFSLDVPIFPIL